MKTKLTLFVTVIYAVFYVSGCSFKQGSFSESLKGRIIYLSPASYQMGLAPWTKDKPVGERYQVYFGPSGNEPFTGNVVVYGYHTSERFLERIEVYKNGELLDFVFYDVKEPLKLINGRFRKVADQDFPARELDVYQESHVIYSRTSTAEERYHVLEIKEWTAEGQLIFHGKNGKAFDPEGPSYTSPFDKNGHPNPHSNYSGFSYFKVWNPDGTPKVKK